MASTSYLTLFFGFAFEVWAASPTSSGVAGIPANAAIGLGRRRRR
jgi:hypothetical protein